MTIEIWTEAGQFINKSYPDAMRRIDLPRSYRNFEKMLEEELRRTYPAAEVSVRVVDSDRTILRVDGDDITVSSRPDAMSFYVNIRSAIDKLFFYGWFWEGKRTDAG